MYDTQSTTAATRIRKGEACYYGTHVQYRTYFDAPRDGVLTGKHTSWKGVMHWEVASDTVDIPARANIWIPVHELTNLDRIANMNADI
jgi:hypothetical protein